MKLSEFKELVIAAVGSDQKFSIPEAEVDALIEDGWKKSQTSGITAWMLMEYAI